MSRRVIFIWVIFGLSFVFAASRAGATLDHHNLQVEFEGDERGLDAVGGGENEPDDDADPRFGDDLGKVIPVADAVPVVKDKTVKAGVKKEQEMEPELVFMPQQGPIRMVPKGSQGLTPVTPTPPAGNQEMEPKLVFMPQQGPIQMVPKGSQGLTPVPQTNSQPNAPGRDSRR